MARADVHVYSFKNVICAIGSHMPSGFAGDNCITITPQGDGITDEAGADGEVVVSNSDDPRYEVKMIFKYGSKSNAVLRKLYNLQKQSSGGYFFPLMIRDLGDNPQFTASKAWVSKPAPIVYGAKGGDQEWTIRCVGEFAPE
ncbi:Uncharacterised protein [Faecalibacterium prausnitzii]|jgi:hypothetical protein|nr:Uncharacterised protein [Faecalibacterium prausnitzii]DAS38802.1 MAG TPA: Protein of unknown function (DUF3277) [Bacteriophage sp.]